MHKLMKLLAIYWAVSGHCLIQKIKFISNVKFQKSIFEFPFIKIHLFYFLTDNGGSKLHLKTI